LTAGPVALLVVGGAVVDVLVEELDGGLVDGAVEVLAGCVVVLVEGGRGAVVDDDEVDWGGGFVPLELFPGGDPVATGVVGEPRVADALGREPIVRGADFVWKASTPARPATVAAITIGVRLIASALSEWPSVPDFSVA
jgi:hypothetical protein